MVPVTSEEVRAFLIEGGYNQDDPTLPDKTAAKCNESGDRDIWAVWAGLLRASHDAILAAAELRNKRLHPNDEDLVGYDALDEFSRHYGLMEEDDPPSPTGYHDPYYTVKRDYEGEELDYTK